TVDVVVPTHRRPDLVVRCLEALRSQQVAPARVVVVRRRDDGATAEALAPWSDWPPLHVVLVDEPGVVEAMSLGIAATTAPVVAFTDDDAAPHADWVERIVAAFTDPSLGALGGRDLLPGPVEPTTCQVGTVGRLGREHGGHHRGRGAARPVVVLKGVNLAVRRSLLAMPAPGVLLGDGLVGWEWVVCEWVRRGGGRVVYDPALLVDHEGAGREPGHERRAPAAAVVEARAANAVFAPNALRHRWTLAARHLLVGDGGDPGLARGLLAVARGEHRIVAIVQPALRGHLRGLRAAFARRDPSTLVRTADQLRALHAPVASGAGS
ncbi:hypothetical protein B7486_61335, partial [cyanobacterium TDX16]